MSVLIMRPIRCISVRVGGRYALCLGCSAILTREGGLTLGILIGFLRQLAAVPTVRGRFALITRGTFAGVSVFIELRPLTVNMDAGGGDRFGLCFLARDAGISTQAALSAGRLLAHRSVVPAVSRCGNVRITRRSAGRAHLCHRTDLSTRGSLLGSTFVIMRMRSRRFEAVNITLVLFSFNNRQDLILVCCSGF